MNSTNNLMFIIKLFYEHKIRILFLVSYSIFCGYITPFWALLIPKAINNLLPRIELILIAIIYFSFSYIKELIAFPIHNYISYQLRKYLINQAHEMDIDTVNAGNIIAKLQRTLSGKLLIKNLTDSIKHLAIIFNSLYLIAKINKIIGFAEILILALHTIGFYFAQKYYTQVRKQAWLKTEEAGKMQEKTINQTIAIRQNLLNIEDSAQSLTDERNAWHDYYFKSNLIFAMLIVCAVSIVATPFFFSQNLTKPTILFISWQLANSLRLLTIDLRVLIATKIDLNIFLTQYHNQSKTKLTYYNFLNIKNVVINKFDENGNHIKKLGPFNFNLDKTLAILTGTNGVGKTQLSLAIANLINYEGEIKAPKTIYISLKEQANLNKKQSMGENAFELINKAFEMVKNEDNNIQQLIIIDELLDILSTEKIQQAKEMIDKAKAMILIITHNTEIMKWSENIIELK